MSNTAMHAITYTSNCKRLTRPRSIWPLHLILSPKHWGTDFSTHSRTSCCCCCKQGELSLSIFCLCRTHWAVQARQFSYLQHQWAELERTNSFWRGWLQELWLNLAQARREQCNPDLHCYFQETFQAATEMGWRAQSSSNRHLSYSTSQYSACYWPTCMCPCALVKGEVGENKFPKKSSCVGIQKNIIIKKSSLFFPVISRHFLRLSGVIRHHPHVKHR